MRRISVVGNTGSGKTTMARALGATLSCSVLELDAVFHQPDWTPLPEQEFVARVQRFIDEEPMWIIDGNYNSHGVLDLVWGHADTVVWLDPPKGTVMRRVLTRSITRAAVRRELWNGNRERWSNLFSWDPERNIVRWAWTRFDHTRSRYESRVGDTRWAHLDVVRLRSARAAEAWIRKARCE